MSEPGLFISNKADFLVTGLGCLIGKKYEVLLKGIILESELSSNVTSSGDEPLTRTSKVSACSPISGQCQVVGTPLKKRDALASRRDKPRKMGIEALNLADNRSTANSRATLDQTVTCKRCHVRACPCTLLLNS